MTLDVSEQCKRHGRAPPVLDGVSLRIDAGAVLGLAGASCAGKSTLARCIAGLEHAGAGRVALAGQVLRQRRTRAERRLVQYVWQEPQAALSPYLTALQAVAEPLQGLAIAPRAQHAEIAAQALAQPGIAPDAMQRRPHALAGGQCQRVVLARALVAGPQVLLPDEPFSALDTVTTAALLRELKALLAGRPIAVLLVSHDRAVLRRIATHCLLLADGCLSSTRP